LEGCSRAVNVVSSPNRVIPHPLIERSGNHPTGAHQIVPSSQPLKDIMRNREATGRIGKWVAELNEFTIEYVHRSSIQSQGVADFIADWTPGAQGEEATKDAEAWTVF
jgi:hypothetical protein